MKNTYIIIGIIVLVAILGFVSVSKKTTAPTNTDNTDLDATSLGVPAKTSLSDGTYTIDTTQSKLTWRGEFITGNGEDGTLSLKSGQVEVTEGVIKGEFSLDMSTIKDSGNKEKLEEHLRSEDFFDVVTYPEAKFNLKTFSKIEGSSDRYVVGGDLTVKNILKPISFIVSLSEENGKMKASSSFAINRADWEIKYNSPSFFGELGDKAIRDAVEIGLEITASKQ